MKIFRNYKMLILTVLVFCLPACSSKNNMLRATNLSTHDFVAKQLGQAVEKAHSELATLSELRGRGVEVDIPPPDPRLAKKISLNWTGSAKEALKTICLDIGYAYREIGSTSHEITIVVYGKNIPAYQLLEDIALQIKQRAFVKVDSISQIITLAYPNNN